MRVSTLLLAASALAAGTWFLACGGNGVQCGPGTQQIGNICIVGDTGDGGATASSSSVGTGGSPASSSASSGGAGGVAMGPSFGGVVSAQPASTTSLFLTWNAAMDAKTPTDKLRYAIFLAQSKGAQHFASPDAIVPNGGLFGVVDGLAQDQSYFVVVRAIDEDGNQDANTIELSTKPVADTTPPTFNGAKTAASTPGGKVTLTWDAASDDLTSPSAIRYRIWASSTTPVDTTGAPLITTAPGALTLDIVEPDPTTDYHFVVRAEDAAGNVDANAHEVSAKPGPDNQPPTFGGCTTATAKDAGTITATWLAAVDDTTPAAKMSYRIYAFKTPGPHADVTVADATIQYDSGVLQGDLGGLLASTPYWLVCHAVDLTGNEDKNDNEQMTTTPADTTPPVFDPGALVATLDAPSTTAIKLSWPAATDNQTAQANIAYDVFQAVAPNGENLMGAPLTTVMGATSAIVMTTPATRLYFVVVARDGANNKSAPLAEVNATTDVSFVTNIQPLFESNCNQCHSLNTFQNTPILDAAFTPTSLNGYFSPGDPMNSILYLDVASLPGGNPMPPVASGVPNLSVPQMQLIADWITEGGQNN